MSEAGHDDAVGTAVMQPLMLRHRGLAVASFAVLSHLARAVLVSAGVMFAMPAISGPLHRTRVVVRRAFSQLDHALLIALSGLERPSFALIGVGTDAAAARSCTPLTLQSKLTG